MSIYSSLTRAPLIMKQLDKVGNINFAFEKLLQTKKDKEEKDDKKAQSKK